MAILSTQSLLVAIVLAALHLPAAPGETIDEYQVKAAFLFNFAKFVDWPAQAFKGPTDPIAICLFGTNPFGNSLEDAVDKKAVGGRAFVVRRVSDVLQAAGCHILFITSSGQKKYQMFGQDVVMNGVLIVGETPGFASEGGIVNLRLEQGRVRIEVNVHAAERANLRISSKLLSLAEIVN